MERINNAYYSDFMKTLYRIDRYHNNYNARKKRNIMVNNLELAVAKAYDEGEMTWDKSRFYRRKITDYITHD